MKANAFVPFMLRRGDGSTLSLDFTTMSGLDSRFTFTRASIGTYIDSAGLVASVSNDAPRFDHDPSTLAPRGLLLEGSATNLLWPSNTGFTLYNTQKVGGAGNETPIAATGIDGTQSAVSFTVTQSGGTAPFVAARAGTGNVTAVHPVTANTVYTFSFYWKAGQSFPLNRTRVLDETANPDTVITPTIAVDVPGPNGFTRRILVVTTPATCTAVICDWAYGTQANGDTYTVTACQLEVGSGASSYIPTGAGTVQRAADSCVMTGANFSSWFNATEGTFLARGSRRLTSNTGMLLSANDAGNNEAMGLGSSTTGEWLIRDGGSDVADITPGTATANTVYRIAGAYKVNDAQAAFNGTLGTQDTSLTLPTVNQLDIGRDRVTVYLDGHVELIKYWPTRLPDATLQALTQ